MARLTLKHARLISDTAIERARELGLPPITVVVLDAGGHMKCLLREDGCAILRPQIAFGKAWGALGVGLPGRELARKGETGANFLTALASASQGRVVPSPGGVLVVDSALVVGAVGVTGATATEDEVCAVAGIEAAGFIADAAAEPGARLVDI